MRTHHRLLLFALITPAIVACTSCTGGGSGPMSTTLHVGEPRASSGEPIELTLPTEMCRGLFLADVLVNGAGPYPMVVDTGASWTVVSTRVKKESGVRGRAESIRMGDFEVANTRVKSQSLSHLGDALGTPIEGIVGHDVFKGVTVIYDYASSQLRVTTSVLDEDANTVPTKKNRSRPFVRTSIDDDRDGEEDGSFWLLIDTGAVGGLSIKPFDDLNYQAPPALTGVKVKIDGEYLEKSARLDGDMTFGPVRMHEPIIENSVRTNLVGFDLLRHYVLSVDQRSGLLRMEPITGEPYTSEPLRGIGVAMRAENGAFLFTRIFKGGAAERAGIFAGDKLIMVNGRWPFGQRCDPDHRILGDDESAVLTIRRDGTQLDIPVRIDVMVD